MAPRAEALRSRRAEIAHLPACRATEGASALGGERLTGECQQNAPSRRGGRLETALKIWGVVPRVKQGRGSLPSLEAPRFCESRSRRTEPRPLEMQEKERPEALFKGAAGGRGCGQTTPSPRGSAEVLPRNATFCAPRSTSGVEGQLPVGVVSAGGERAARRGRCSRKHERRECDRNASRSHRLREPLPDGGSGFPPRSAPLIHGGRPVRFCSLSRYVSIEDKFGLGGRTHGTLLEA
jgi:hypothetical protein